MNRKFIAVAALGILMLPLTVHAEDAATRQKTVKTNAERNYEQRSATTTERMKDIERGRMQDEERATEAKLLNRASEVFAKLTAENEQVQQASNDAECIAVFPDVRKVALVVGGTSGDGIVTCKTEDGWSQVSFLDFHAGSLGAQIGTTSTDLCNSVSC